MKTFSFNLIPKKEKEVVIKEEKRDKMSIYLAFLPLIGVMIWLFLVLFNGLVVIKSKMDWTQAVVDKQARIDKEFLPVREQYGELVVKTQVLSEIVQKDIKPETLFILTEKIFPAPEQEIVIIGYGRKDDGSFTVALETSDYQKLAEVSRRFTDYKGSTEVGINGASYDFETGKTIGNINFNLDVDYIENDGQ